VRETLILHLPEQADGQCAWRVQSTALGNVSERTGHGALAEALAEAAALSQVRLIVLVPTEKIVLTQVSLPIRMKSSLLQAVPYALEDKLADDIDELHFSLGARQSDGSTPVAVVAIKQMQEWMIPFQEAGLQPELMIPDVLALPYTAGQVSLCMTSNGHCLVRTGATTGFSLPIDLLGFSLQTDEITAINLLKVPDSPALPGEFSVMQSHAIESVLEGLRHYTESATRINLLQGAFAPTSSSGQWLRAARIPAAIAASWLLLATAGMALQNQQLRSESDQLREHAQQSFNRAFPQITRIVDLRIQADQALQRMRSGGASGGLLSLLSQSSPALSKTTDLKLDGLQYRDGSLYLNLSGSDLQALERLRTEFAKIIGLKLEVQSAQAGSDGVQIRLKVDQA
jgi:general secretion pathway protein L